MSFIKQILTEKRDVQNSGIIVESNLIILRLQKDLNNNLMRLNIEASQVLPKLPSLETFKKEYDADEKDLEKIWKTVMQKHSKDIDKLVNDFEKNIKTIIFNISKDLK